MKNSPKVNTSLPGSPPCRGLWASVFVLLLPASLLAAEPQQLLLAEPQQLLLDMTRAIETRNYKGTLVYIQPGKADTFRVFHRVVGDQATEKVIAMDGEGSEIIRTPDEIICILPKQRKVVVAQRGSAKGEQNPLRASLPEYTPSIAAHYNLQIVGKDRVANRSAMVIAIKPTDEFRYGYRLWLDTVSTMPLKIQLLAATADMPVEELFFTSISLPDVLDEVLVKPSSDTAEYDWVRHGETDDQLSAPLADIRWRAVELPDGFMETVAALEYMRESSGPRTHLVYSDGLASVSVFIDLGVAASEQVEGLTTVGATNAYSLMIDGFLVTAMGEVPPATVQLIATSIELQPDSAGQLR